MEYPSLGIDIITIACSKNFYKENIEFKGNEILEDEERILFELHQLYDQVIEEVSRKVKNAKQEKEGFRKKWVEQKLQNG
ncbi:unknown [Firmicutes bacterium CAG:308]|nr:unknown [Firmicutes bacterium CAG:308]